MEINEYLLTLIGASILVSTVAMLAPRGGKRYVRLCSCLCLLCVILAPLPNIAKSLEDGSLSSLVGDGEADDMESFYEEIYNNTVNSANGEMIADALENMMTKDLSLPEGGFSVTVDTMTENGEVTVKKVTVRLGIEAIGKDPREIVGYLEKMLGCECEIIYY